MEKLKRYSCGAGDGMFEDKEQGHWISYEDHKAELENSKPKGLLLVLKDKEGDIIKDGDIIKHNDNEYIIWSTDNYGIVGIREKHFNIDSRILMTSQKFANLDLFVNAKKYIKIIGNVLTPIVKQY